MSVGVRNPRRSVRICIAVLALAGAAVVWGLYELARTGEESPVASAAVGIGLFVCVIFAFFLFNFLWAARLTERMQRGENVIARWTVPLQTLEEFRADDANPKKMRRRNDYRLPRKLPPDGLEVIFSPDAVMIGDTFFGLARAGIARFTDVSTVPGNPLSIAFRMALTTARGTSYGGATVRTTYSELRIPIARTASAEASKVLAHYTAVHQGRIQVKPKFWTLRIRIGLWSAAIGAISFAIGLTLDRLRVDLGLLPMLIGVIGGVIVPFGLLLALIAWRIREGERRER